VTKSAVLERRNANYNVKIFTILIVKQTQLCYSKVVLSIGHPFC